MSLLRAQEPRSWGWSIGKSSDGSPKPASALLPMKRRNEDELEDIARRTQQKLRLSPPTHTLKRQRHIDDSDDDDDDDDDNNDDDSDRYSELGREDREMFLDDSLSQRGARRRVTKRFAGEQAVLSRVHRLHLDDEDAEQVSGPALGPADDAQPGRRTLYDINEAPNEGETSRDASAEPLLGPSFRLSSSAAAATAMATTAGPFPSMPLPSLSFVAVPPEVNTRQIVPYVPPPPEVRLIRTLTEVTDQDSMSLQGDADHGESMMDLM